MIWRVGAVAVWSACWANCARHWSRSFGIAEALVEVREVLLQGASPLLASADFNRQDLMPRRHGGALLSERCHGCLHAAGAVPKRPGSAPR